MTGRYRDALRALSARTGTALPSLIFSFAVLHEVTAIASLVGVFYGARALGVGDRLLHVAQTTLPSAPDQWSMEHWMRGQWKTWVAEGEKWAEKVGRRYGFFGYEKEPMMPVNPEDGTEARAKMSGRIAGDVANAIVAYGLTKAIAPIRIPLSMYLSPAFSRRVVDPVSRNIFRLFKRSPPRSS
ncbi:hypothetical protein GLOTRDRAFT_111133 [Gloeophyllum trabeum ATCC 11539]|uniref:Uncharacterized protein n=1 Tax=Gloeophyllum trabeum (strain ATCC 11539 / FP-39264 / Madison 617) TaxID=670483 RepID=S7Q6T1_GLOTA|nr:uncharacterized protein GLOTRDRAFT_111133 [Gloeophyllum trabeum ATCC 11539]EPQ55133.1 hypothetical protein GLOTRDRAFT_111133 [Gloeophyllum trabeum ATCC 11539]